MFSTSLENSASGLLDQLIYEDQLGHKENKLLAIYENEARLCPINDMR